MAKYKVVYGGAGRVPMAVPEAYVQKVSPNWNMFLRITRVSAVISASMGTSLNRFLCWCRCCPISQRAAMVLMFVYIETALAEKRWAFSGRLRVWRWFFSARKSSKHAGWALAIGWRMESNYFSTSLRMMSGQETIGHVSQGSLWILMVWYKETTYLAESMPCCMNCISWMVREFRCFRNQSPTLDISLMVNSSSLYFVSSWYAFVLVRCRSKDFLMYSSLSVMHTPRFYHRIPQGYCIVGEGVIGVEVTTGGDFGSDVLIFGTYRQLLRWNFIVVCVFLVVFPIPWAPRHWEYMGWDLLLPCRPDSSRRRICYIGCCAGSVEDCPQGSELYSGGLGNILSHDPEKISGWGVCLWFLRWGRGRPCWWDA